MSIRIITDSNCDLPQGMVNDYGITVVPMYINIGSESYLDGVTMSRQEFYEGLPNFDSHPMTSVPGPGTFIEAFERLAPVHTHALEAAEALGHQARHLAPEGLLSMSAEATPVIGTHIGPGAVGFIAIKARQ